MAWAVGLAWLGMCCTDNGGVVRWECVASRSVHQGITERRVDGGSACQLQRPGGTSASACPHRHTPVARDASCAGIEIAVVSLRHSSRCVRLRGNLVAASGR